MKLTTILMLMSLLLIGCVSNPTATTDARAAVGVTANADWTPVEDVKGGVAMVLVPAGCFMMGSDTGSGNEWPVGEVCLTPFWLDKTEVTQAQFVANGGEKARANRFTGDNRPVERITWFEADAYCREQRGGRLPTEAEWEFAARGSAGLVYPWGNEFVAENVVYDSNANETAEVGSKPSGASWVGALDLSGNVWEWTASLYEPYPYRTDGTPERDTGNSTNVRRVLRGGSWFNGGGSLRAAFRSFGAPGNSGIYIGFRCALS